jgi:hypothetical protein
VTLHRRIFPPLYRPIVTVTYFEGLGGEGAERQSQAPRVAIASVRSAGKRRPGPWAVMSGITDASRKERLSPLSVPKSHNTYPARCADSAVI